MFVLTRGRVRSCSSCWSRVAPTPHDPAAMVFDLGQGQAIDVDNLFAGVVDNNLLSRASIVQGFVGLNWPQTWIASQRRRASPYHQNHQRTRSHSTLTQVQCMYEHVYNETTLPLDQMHRSGWSHMPTTIPDPAHIHPKLV